jgi:signal-transduction protein with cAMP-binding, CBS, and nucleotidyltransferase domain
LKDSGESLSFDLESALRTSAIRNRWWPMICPNCGYDNLPGSEECNSCLQDLTQLDRPIAANRVERSLMEDPVGSLCGHHKPVVVRPCASVHDAIQAMLTPGVGALLVVDDLGKLVGIFTERDLLTKAVDGQASYEELRVEQFMTPNPETVKACDTLAFALHKMDVGGYRHLPVVRDGRPEGVISVRDMLRHITRLCKDC